MPLKQGYTSRNGESRGYYQWGDSGKKYTYSIGNDNSRVNAKNKAKRQGRAIEMSKHS